MRYKIGNILWGLAFILAGVGIAGNAFDLWNFNLFFNGWWTLFIIVPCFISIIQNGFNTGNSIGLAVGALLLVGAQDIFPRYMVAKLFFPAILVIIGLSIVFGRRYYNGYNPRHHAAYTSEDGNVKVGDASGEYQYHAADTASNGSANNKNYESHGWNNNCGPDLVAVFCGNSGSYRGRECKGAACTAVFGGVELDLRGAEIKGNITVNATAIFGGVDVFVDDKVQVQYRSVPIFGGVDCAVPPRDNALPTVFVNCVAIFGGIDIK